MQKLHLAALSGNEAEVEKLLGKGVGKWFKFIPFFTVTLLYLISNETGRTMR